MKNASILLIVIALCLAPSTVRAQGATSVTGAGAAAFAAGAVLNDVSLSAMRFGIGVDIPGDGTASGDVQATLLGAAGGAARTIVVEGKAASGSISALGVSTISGVCSIDPGDGSTPLSAVPFTLSVATGADGHSSLSLVLGAATLPAAAVTNGTISVR